MFDYLAISAIIISSFTALTSCIVAMHIKKAKSGCLSCETVEDKIKRVISSNNIIIDKNNIIVGFNKNDCNDI
jgi:hypothetical protein